MNRCQWANPNNPRYIDYHDHEWGQPCHDEVKLFEMLNLEGAQAGLSWETVLNKRDAYRLAFDHWDAHQIAHYDESKFDELMRNPGIIRNRLKIRAAIQNAKSYLELKDEWHSLDRYIWSFTDGQTIVRTGQRNTSDELSDRISKDLKKRGFKFVGTTIVYAYLQAIGVISEHSATCDWRT